MGMGISKITKTPILILFLAVGFFVGISFSSVYAGIPWDTDDIADDAITTDKIKDKTVKTVDIRGGAIKTGKIRDGTIQLDDLSSELRVLLGLGTCPNTSSLGFVYQGQVTSVDDPDNFLGGGINVGEMIEGVYCYAPNTPDTDGDAQIGLYSLDFHSISIGNDDFECSNELVLVILNDFFGRDVYNVVCDGMSSSLYSLRISNGLMELSDKDETIFVDDSLPQSAPDFNEFETKAFVWKFGDDIENISGKVIGTIISLIQIQ